MDKKEIATVFEEIAFLLELKAENPFRVRAYRNAALAILNLDEDLQKVIKEERLTEIPGIGEDLAEKITTLFKTGRLPFYEKLKKSAPPGVSELMQIQGLGPKKIMTLYKKLKIHSIKALKEACLKNKVAALPRFGKKTQDNILNAITHREVYGQRHLWWNAVAIVTSLLEGFQKLKGVKKVEIAGSFRRKLETVGDLDFVIASSKPKPIMDWFISHPLVASVLAKGETKSSVRLKEGMQVDLRIVPEEQFGSALCYSTGSREHTIRIRQMALKKGWSLSEWGITSKKNKKMQAMETENALYKALGLSYIAPELREDRGEFEAAAKGKLPKLIEEEDIRGTFHNHTTSSDGKNTLQEMVTAAQKLGWEYIGISDHSKSSFQANGMTEERLHKQVEQIRALNASKKFRLHIFTGVECDILPNGALDFSDKVLKALDYVIVSVHSVFNQDEKTMTKRLIRAIEHPYSTMVGHVTGRILLKREGYRVNIQKVIDACIANGKIMELNATPNRLDMDWRFWHSAAEKGLLCCINTDAHSTDHLEFFRAGVNAARKGWLEKKQVINTLPLKELQKLLKKIQG